MKKRMLKIMKYFVLPLLIGVLVGNILSYSVTFVLVPTNSMEPTIKEKTIVLAKRATKKDIEDIKRGDIVVLEAQDGVAIRFRGRDFSNFNMVKRVIGLGGDTVEILDGVVYINNTPLSESYVSYRDSFNMSPIKVPKGEFFLLGDNRLSSFDSRYWDIKTLKSSKIKGIYRRYN